jgi:hypothetical protein
VPVIKPAQEQIQNTININTQKRKTEDKANKPKAAHITRGAKQQYKLITWTEAPYPGNIDRLIRERHKLLVA